MKLLDRSDEAKAAKRIVTGLALGLALAAVGCGGSGDKGYNDQEKLEARLPAAVKADGGPMIDDVRCSQMGERKWDCDVHDVSAVDSWEERATIAVEVSLDGKDVTYYTDLF